MTTNRNNGRGSNRRDILYIILFLAFTVAVWTAVQTIPGVRSVSLPTAGGVCDLAGVDFENAVYSITGNWQSYPEKLYAPSDFENGLVTDAPVLSESVDYRQIQYATHRLTLLMPPGQTYGILIKTSDYSMRLFIDGIEIDSVGVPGDTRESSVPRTTEKVYSFTPTGDAVTVTVQTSNFVHHVGAYPPGFTIGSFENITRKNVNETAAVFVLIGCLLTAFLYHLGLFLLSRTRKNVLIFAVCCLLLALLSKKWLFVFFPDYNWFFAIRFEYIVHFAAFAMLTLFLDTLYPKLLRRFVTRAYYALAGLYTLMTLALDTTVFTRLLFYFEIASVGMILYVLTRLAMALRFKNLQRTLSFVGVFVIGLLGLSDILYYRSFYWVPHFSGLPFTTPVGMAFFVFCFALVLSIEYAETERREEELTAKTEFYHRMAHDLLTPLTKISTNIQIAGLRDDADHERLEKSQEEIMRMAAMINDALNDGDGGESESGVGGE